MRGSVKKQIEIKFVGFPKVYDFFKGPCIQHAFKGKTLLNLIEDLMVYYGEPLRESFLIKRTQALDLTIQAKVNGNYIKREAFNRQVIEDGDRVTLLRLMAGG